MMDSVSALAESAAMLIAGRYAVESALGEGGMGAVFQVTDQQSGRRIALKRLRAKKDSSALLLFQREYFTLTELAHPRIIEVYDYGVDAEGAYYTMELLDGADLRERKNLGWQEICPLLCDVASSLAILHSRGLLHRDISPRNVRCTADGRAKLIDFGAMTAMGVAREFVGTPPCVPPEALQLQALDGRADLYALGVVAYFTLTGRYPYPARTMAELPELWLRPVRPLGEAVPGIPEALANLVTELISFDPGGRPRTAGEVVERLSAVAGLPLNAHESAARAYLTTPGLVGRKAFVEAVRGQIGSVLQGRGQALLIEGESGMGRSRALDVCVAEAKRIGAVVARATAIAAASKDYGVAVALSRQLIQNLPGSAARFGVQERSILAPLLDELRRPGDPERPLERRHVQAALRDWMLGLARQHRLMLAVDDLEQVDEPSAALLAMLAHELKRRSMIIAVTRKPGAAVGLASDVLSQLGTVLQLTALSETETEALVRSVFGDVENVVGVAARVHEVARGNPRDTMQLLGHLVECGSARCEGAAWLLPTVLADSDLPGSMRSAFDARLSILSPDAHVLAEALALTDPTWLALEDYASVVALSDPARLFSALAALVQSGVLQQVGDRYRFVERNAAVWLEERMAPEQKRVLHARLAEVAERRSAPIRRLHHLLESSQAVLAIHELVEKLGTDALDYSKQTVELLERAISASQSAAVPEAQRLAMKLRLVGVSAVTAELETFQRYAPEALARLRRDSGLDDWEELDPALPEGERLQTALMRVQARFEATPEHERGFPAFESIRRLARLLTGFGAMAGAATQRSLYDGLPSLRPFFVLSPATQVMESMVQAGLALEEGRVSLARSLYASVLSRIAEPDGAGMEPVIREYAKNSITYVVAAIDAASALPSTLALTDELEKVPKHRANAWHARRSYYRMLGQPDKVRDCQRRIELFQLRDGPQPLRNINFRIDLAACWLSDDLTGLKSWLSGIEAEAARFPGLRVLLYLAVCHYHRLRGEHELALQQLELAMEIAKPGCHLDWHHVASSHVDLLTLLGRPEEALAQAEVYDRACHELGLDRAQRGLDIARTRALIAAGRAEEARERCDRVIAFEEAQGTSGVMLLRIHQARARVALALGDREGFEHWAARSADFCEASQSPAIRALHSALMREAVRQGLTDAAAAAAMEQEAPNLFERVQSATLNLKSGTVEAGLAHCIDKTERSRLALSFALEASQARRGHLFGIRQTELEPLASFPDQDAPENLQRALFELFEQERAADQRTACGDTVPDAPEHSAYQRVADLGFSACMLLTHRLGDPAIVGVLAIEQQPATPALVPAQVAEAIAEALAERGDVDPVTVFG